jgi:uncharacterized protein
MFVYLHGLASSPSSTKAQDLAQRFASQNLALTIPDLNQNDFTHLTLSRQIAQVRSLLSNDPVTIIGSSFGGLTAAWLGQICPQVSRLVLLAPAFHYLDHWLPTLDQATWQAERLLQVYHYSAKRTLPLDYQIVEDLQKYDESQLQRVVPTLILHGIWDEVIPVQASREYRIERPWVQLIELESDHALTDQSDTLWNAIAQFCF